MRNKITRGFKIYNKYGMWKVDCFLAFLIAIMLILIYLGD